MAVEDVRKNKMSLRSAAILHKVPRATLCDALKHGVDESRRRGPPAVLGEETETEIVSCVLNLANAVFPITRNQLI